MISQINSFRDEKLNLLETFHKSMHEIDKTLDKEIDDLTILQDKIGDQVLDQETQVYMDRLIDEINLKNKDITNTMADLYMETLKIMASAEGFCEDINDVKGIYTKDKNYLMSTLEDEKEKIFSLNNALKVKINKIKEALKYLSKNHLDEQRNLEIKINEMVDIKLRNLINGELKIPINQLQNFQKLDTCNTVECIKDQIKYMQNTIVNQNKAIEKISQIISNQLTQLQSKIGDTSNKYTTLQAQIQKTFLDLSKLVNDVKFSLQNRISLIEDQQRLSTTKKYF